MAFLLDLLSHVTGEDENDAAAADPLPATPHFERRPGPPTHSRTTSNMSNDLMNDVSDDDLYNPPAIKQAHSAPPDPAPSSHAFSSIFRSISCFLFSAAPEQPPPVRNWHIAFDDIRQLAWLGAGAHGCVFLGVYRDEMVAVKKLKELEMTQKEMRHLQQLDHENIVRLIGVCLQAPTFALVMEYCAESLYDLIHKQEVEIPPRLVLLYASQIACGMEYLHQRGIIHRDLKSPNVLKSKDRLKISDFGTCKERPDRSMKFSFIGTVAWMAPEVIRNEVCSDSVDLWSFGVLLWELLTCKIPYQGVDPGAIVWGVGSNSLKLPIPTSTPDGFSLLLQQCWNTTPRNRPAFRQILIHLDILSGDEQFGVLAESSYLISQQSWKAEVEKTFRSMRQESDEHGPTDSTEARRDEFSHIDDIRIHYERNLEECRQQRAQLQEMARLLQMKEDELARKEEQMRRASSPKKRVVKENLQSRAKVIEELFERKRKTSEQLSEGDAEPIDDSGVSPRRADTSHSRTPSDLSFLAEAANAERMLDSVSSTDNELLAIGEIHIQPRASMPDSAMVPSATTTPQTQPVLPQDLFSFL